MRAMTRMAPLTRPTTMPAMERLLRECVSCLSLWFDRLVPVAAAEDKVEDVVEPEDVDELDVVDEADELVEEVVLLLVDEVVMDDLLILRLVRDVIKLVGIDMEVGLEMGIDMEVGFEMGIDIEVGLEVGMTILVVGRLNVVGIVTGVVDGANVPGTDAGAVH
jgi:hypothetical protein